MPCLPFKWELFKARKRTSLSACLSRCLFSLAGPQPTGWEASMNVSYCRAWCLHIELQSRVLVSGYWWQNKCHCSSGWCHLLWVSLGNLRVYAPPWGTSFTGNLRKMWTAISGVVVRVCLVTPCSLGRWLMLPQQRMTHDTESIRGNITFSVSCLRLII